MTPNVFVAQLQSTFEPHRNPGQATAMAAYMKNTFPFLGLPSPQRVALAKPLVGEVKGQVNDAFLHRTARLLWALPEREYHYTAIELLSHYARHLSSSSLGKIEYLILHKSWWDSIDPLASLVGKALPRFPGWLDTIDTWSTHPNFWLRRTAIVYQRGCRSQTDAERLFRYCQLNAQDPEFFIRKAIGWALREYAKTDARAVRQFIEKHRATLSPLSIREASKYL